MLATGEPFTLNLNDGESDGFGKENLYKGVVNNADPKFNEDFTEVRNAIKYLSADNSPAKNTTPLVGEDERLDNIIKDKILQLNKKRETVENKIPGDRPKRPKLETLDKDATKEEKEEVR